MPTNLILALDVEDREKAKAVLREIGPSLRTVKIGLQLFTRYGPDIVREIHELVPDIFLDLKLHDIPNTIAKSVESLANLPISMLTLHASGGKEMMEAANRARSNACPDLDLLAVTVLTSIDRAALAAIGVDREPAGQVVHLARLAIESGVQGLVSSPRELALLRKEFGTGPRLVTPGIRPADKASHEQKRVMTPGEAAAAGANHIVVGRPILEADDPKAAVNAILNELDTAE